MEDTYTRFIHFLEQHGVKYRLIDHEPEGRTEIISAIRGNPLAAAAKCIILMVKIGKKVTRYVLAVVPGDTKVDMNAVKALLEGTYVSFAPTDVAERLAGSQTGTILPFTFDPALELMVDPALLEHEELYFNVARLDQSIVIRSKDYVTVARPRLEKIAQPPGPA